MVVEPRVRWWKLKEIKYQERLKEEVIKSLQGSDELPESWETTADMLRKAGEKVLGMTSGKRQNGKETWWWNEAVQERIKDKKKAKKAWDILQDDDSKRKYKESRKFARK